MTNVQTIKQDDLWKLGMGIRCVVNGKEYLYIGRMDGLGEYVAANGVMYYDDEEELQSDEILVDIVPDMQRLYEAKLRNVLSLIDDGWVDNGNGMDIRPYVDELRLIKMLRDMADGK